MSPCDAREVTKNRMGTCNPTACSQPWARPSLGDTLRPGALGSLQAWVPGTGRGRRAAAFFSPEGAPGLGKSLDRMEAVGSQLNGLRCLTNICERRSFKPDAVRGKCLTELFTGLKGVKFSFLVAKQE